MLLMFRGSLVILSLLTMFIILSLDTTSTINLQDKFFKPVSAQGFSDAKSGIQNETAESTTPTDRSLIVKLLADNLENRQLKIDIRTYVTIKRNQTNH